jgi:hypothetical protein
MRTWIDERSGIFEIPNAPRTRHLYRLFDRGSRCWPDSHIKLRLAGCPLPIATCNLRAWNLRSCHHVAPRCRGLTRSLGVPMTIRHLHRPHAECSLQQQRRPANHPHLKGKSKKKRNFQRSKCACPVSIFTRHNTTLSPQKTTCCTPLSLGTLENRRFLQQTIRKN